MANVAELSSEIGRAAIGPRFDEQGFSYLRKIYDEKQKHELALKLAKLLIKRESVCMQGGCYINDHSVIAKTIINDTAVKHGIIEVVDVILEECPWAIEFVDENGKNILHLAAEFCQLRVFHLLKSKLGFLTMTKIIANVDRKGNTTLHFAAKFDDRRQNKIHISAYKMALETHWFKKLKGLSPTHHLQFRNSDGKTANELFDDTHKQLIKDGVKWIKNTANTIMLVSTLIATMNFTAAFAVPGGYHQVTGLPIFASKTRDSQLSMPILQQHCFSVLAPLEAPVYLSRFHMDEFYFNLPLKYIMVGSSLFCSAIYTVAVFVQALILVNNGDFTTIGWCFGISAIIAAVILFILVYVDVMFPFFRYFGYLLFE
ncbi:uncharacterized protein LOC122086896 [Macadamia integrifolia]|uniref:uncharacterized protein LOC122086896 n=1 Tax=Macadamia integrifolia TaxID=60698 RepID=UPI001C4F5C7C|nr:uncharacterized protein LOC122086896 [Macadamia integrifolia]